MHSWAAEGDPGPLVLAVRVGEGAAVPLAASDPSRSVAVPASGVLRGVAVVVQPEGVKGSRVTLFVTDVPFREK